MTIAVSVLVRPSGLLLAAQAVMCLAIFGAGAAIVAGAAGDLPLAARMTAGSLCGAIAVLGFYQALRKRKTFRIDISGVGQIRLGEDNGAAASSRTGSGPDQRGSGEVVQLMADSTIWPRLLCLRLEGADRRIIQIVVLPDSTTAEGFRALSVACRWIAAHNNCAEGEHV